MNDWWFVDGVKKAGESGGQRLGSNTPLFLLLSLGVMFPDDSASLSGFAQSWGFFLDLVFKWQSL